MDTLRLKPRQPVMEPVMDEFENWDDDDFMIDTDDLAFRSSSTTTNAQPNRRDSHSSFRSDRESLGGQEERQVHLPGDDEKSTLDAIAAAAHAGIPIPVDVPPSALMGGTIRRLGGRSVKKIIQEDWGDDLELPDSGQTLRLKSRDGTKFPEAIRQVSGSGNPSPVKQSQTITQLFSPKSPKEIKRPALATPINLDKFKDNDEDDDIFGDGGDTIKAPKLRTQAKPISLITPPTPQPPKKEDDDFEMDLELPSDGKLKLSRRRDIPKTPSLNANDDFDWGESSLGTRFGGTRRDAFSNRSSSVSALSPSIASSMTAESEDETLDGLELPNGPLDLGERLKRRKLSRSPARSTVDQLSQPSKHPLPIAEEKEDPLSGLELGDGDVFGSGKLSLHRNVKVKEAQPAVPARPKAAVSLIFTNKPVTGASSSRLPRPMISHERSHTQPSLEPVSESGGPIQSRPSRRSQSRMGHSTQSSISSIHTPTTPTPASTFHQQTTPRRKELSQKTSMGALRGEPTTTNSQLLRLKRSLPALRPGQPPAKPATSRFERPPSRTDSSRPPFSLRPKTPVERPRSTYESSAAQARRTHAPFLPAGASHGQSQNVNAKASRVFRRHDSDHGPEVRPLSRAFSRSAMRSPSPRRQRNGGVASEPIWQQLSKPRRVRQFGDGHELDGFDDLPTSAQTESKFTKQPVGSGNRSHIRNRLYQNVLPDRKTPSPVSPYSPSRVDYQPHFARDTTASRLAREASLAQRTPPSGPLAPLTTQRIAQLSTRTNLNPSHPQNTIRAKKSRKPQQQKPHLISNLNSAKESKVVNGMTYNPVTYRWEGNENALSAFNAPASTPSTTSLPPHMQREKEASTPGPVLIKDMSSSKGAKRIGDMVFDPQAMCWLKVDTSTPDANSDDPMEGFNAMEDDDDPFKDIPDLEDKDIDNAEGGHGRVSDIKDEWLVGEEFDVGPEFIRRQREEEERWRKKCEKWVGIVDRDREAWRWAIKDIIRGI